MDTSAQPEAGRFRELGTDLEAVSQALDREQHAAASAGQSWPPHPPAREREAKTETGDFPDSMHDLSQDLAALDRALGREHTNLTAAAWFAEKHASGPLPGRRERPASQLNTEMHDLNTGLEAVGHALDREEQAASNAGQPWPPLPDTPIAARIRELDTEMHDLGTGLAELSTAFDREHDALTSTAQARAGEHSASHAQSRHAAEVSAALETEDDYTDRTREAERQAQAEPSPQAHDEVEIG